MADFERLLSYFLTLKFMTLKLITLTACQTEPRLTEISKSVESDVETEMGFDEEWCVEAVVW